ncbi:hypothetical protein C7U80_24615 [Escherichia coli]|nr:hypothetical protein C7U80_24615 [Escherichia coli]
MFDKKLAQEDKNHLALMLCLRSLITSNSLINCDSKCSVLSRFAVYHLINCINNIMIFNVFL